MDELKAVIRSILTSTTTTLSIYQLSKDYRNTIGGPVPYQKFGYNSLEHMLKSLPDVVIVKGSGPYAELIVVQSEKSAHVDHLVSKQKTTVKKKQSWCYNQRRSVPHPVTYNKRPTFVNTNTTKPPPRLSSNHIPPLMNNAVQPPPIVPNEPSSIVTKESPSMVTKESSSIVTKQSSSIVTKESSPIATKESSQYNYRRPTDIFNQQPQPTSSFLPNKTYETFHKPIIPHQTPSQLNQKRLTLPELNQLHSKTSTPKPQSLTLNKENLEKLQQKLNISDSTSSSNVYVNSNKIETKEPKNDLKPPVENAERHIPYTVKYNLKTLIEKYPEGIWCAEVPAIYKKLFRSELRYEELGFKSLIELCSSLPSIFHYVRPSTGDFKLYYKNRPLPDSAEKTFTVASYQVDGKNQEMPDALPSFDWKDIEYLLPPDIFNLGEEIPRDFAPDDIEVNQEIDVGRGEVYDLSKFWVYINNGALDELMKNLQDFYTHKAEKYHIPKNVITEGLYCVLLFDEEYHRALIITLLDEGSVKVIFIDYGTTSKVSASDLYFLHESFAKLPAQAIRCRLANIRPPVGGAPWRKEAVHRFRELFSSYKSYTAKIIGIDRKSLILDIYLWENSINSSDNIYVNDRLVKEGLAIYTDQVPQKMLKLKKCRVKHLHLFPTFEELECGLAPSTSELETMQRCGMVLKFIYPQYFLESSKKEQLQRVERIEGFFAKYCQESNFNGPAFEELATCAPFNFDVFKGLGDKIENYYDIKIDSENKSSVEVLNNNKSEESIHKEDVTSVMDQLTKDCLELLKDIGASSEINLQGTNHSNQGSSDSSICELLDELDELGSITDDVVNLTDLTLEDMDISQTEPNSTMDETLEKTLDQNIPLRRPGTNPFIDFNDALADVTFKLDSHNPFLTFSDTEENYDSEPPTNNVPTYTEEVDATDTKSSSASSESTSYGSIEKANSKTWSEASSNQDFESVAASEPESERVRAAYQGASYIKPDNVQRVPTYPVPSYSAPNSTYLCPPYLYPYHYQYQQYQQYQQYGYPNLNSQMPQYPQQSYPQFRPRVPLPPGFTPETIFRNNNRNIGVVGHSFPSATSAHELNRNVPRQGDFYDKYNEKLYKQFGGNNNS